MPRPLAEVAADLLAAQVPFVHGGRDPAAGLDCWGLFRHVYREAFGLELPDYDADAGSAPRRIETASLAAREVRGWRPVPPSRERPGDGVLLLQQGRPTHVAVCLWERRILHTTHPVGISVQRYDGLEWRNRVVGFFRWPELEGAPA